MSEEEVQRIIGNIQLRLVAEKVGGIETRTKDEIVLIKCIQELQQRISDAIEYIEKYESIKAYYEYEECGYTEYNYDEDFKEELLEILKGDNNDN